MLASRRLSASLFVCALAATLTSCNGTHTASLPAKAVSLHGKVFGGQQPITDSTIQLWAVGTTADGSASSPMLTTTVTTSDGTGATNANANPGNSNNTLAPGGFVITGDYTCPAGDALVYMTASGGNPGLTAGTNNPAIQLIAAFGSCQNLQANVQNISINELTTVGSVAALYPYMSAYNAIGSTPAHDAALTAAFNVANEYVNYANGQAPGPALPAGYEASTTDVNALADVLAACVNSPGGTYNDGTVCGNLFYYAKPTNGTAATDIAGAMLQIRNNPTNNVANIFYQQQPSAPFLPVPTAPPADFTLPILAQPGTPAFSIAAGNYTTAQSVTITDSDPTAVIYYTLDGTTPTTASQVYSSALTIGSNTTVKALAVESGRVYSAIASATYTISLAVAPVFSPAGGTFASAQNVFITSSTPGASIYYTLDGSMPGTGSRLYTSGGILVSTSETVQAIAVASGYASSAVASASFTITVPSGTISTVAGNNATGFCCDGSAATGAEIFAPKGIALDSAGNLYIADSGNNRIRKVDTSGIITTVAGNGTAAYTGDGGAATSATLNGPFGVAVDGSGNLYIADTSNNVIRMVNSAGIISTVAGNGSTTYSSAEEGGPALSASISGPDAVAIDPGGNLVIADTVHERIRRVTTAGGIVTIAGNGNAGYMAAQDGGSATAANLTFPYAIAFDAAGDFFIADSSANRIRKVTAAGIITTVAGNGSGVYNAGQNGGLATSAAIDGPRGIAVDASGSLYISEAKDNRLRKVSPSGIISTLAGTSSTVYSTAQEGAPALTATLNSPAGILTDAAGNIYIADSIHYRVRKIDTSGNIYTIAGNGYTTFSTSQDGHLATSAQISNPYMVVPDAAGNLYFTDGGNNRVRKVDTAGIITTIAGNGSTTYSASQEGGPAVNAGISSPTALALDAAGDVFFADNNSRVYKIDTSGNITTVAGNGSQSFGGDGGPATSASVNLPRALIATANGTLYIADTFHFCVRMVTPAGTISTIAGICTSRGYSGDGGQATSATMTYPEGIALDAAGNLYISDSLNYAIRKVDTTGVITTIAGNGSLGFAGDGGPASGAQFSGTNGIAFDAAGNLYIADSQNERIRKIDTSSNISTVAGNGSAGYFGDGGAATSAGLGSPYGISLDASGNLFIADTTNNVIRKVTH